MVIFRAADVSNRPTTVIRQVKKTPANTGIFF
jgi:hypothetical protein